MRLLRITAALVMVASSWCAVVTAEAAGGDGPADIVYTGGDILTMAGPEPEYVESLAVRDGKILFAGGAEAARKLAGPATRTVGLGGQTLLPGFIDTHGHFIYFGKNLVDANLFGCVDVADLVARMQAQAERTPAGGWIVGFGYQARQMKEGRPPSAGELAAVSADRPVMRKIRPLVRCVPVCSWHSPVSLQSIAYTAPSGPVVRSMPRKKGSGDLRMSGRWRAT